MHLIQAKVSKEQFKAFSHYLVDGDLTVSEAIIGWIEEHCGVAVSAPKTPEVKSGGESVVTTGGLVKPTPVAIPVPPKPIVDQQVMSAYVSAPVGGGQTGKDALSAAKEAFKAPVVYPDEVVSARHKCAICHLSFPETEMTYHAKTLRWA